MSRHLLVLLASLALAGCGGRSLPIADGALEPDRGVKKDTGGTAPDARPAADAACALPAGYCGYDSLVDPCPAGYSCQGCYACKGKAYWSCGCTEIVPCSVCSACIGTCLPKTPAICSSNKDCASDQYCHLDGHCVVTGAIAGTCTPRPQGCTADCPAVCGCDGKTYCNACGAHAAGVSVATTRSCFAATCPGLESAYAAEILKAKQCCPMCAALQCTFKVPAKLACGCDTVVNIQTLALQQIRDEWLARGCSIGITCPAIKCAPPMLGNCFGNGGGDGLCEDWGED